MYQWYDFHRSAILLWCHLRPPGFVITLIKHLSCYGSRWVSYDLWEELGGKNTNQKRGVSILCYLAWTSVLILHDT